jgi:hypothetical protein
MSKVLADSGAHVSIEDGPAGSVLSQIRRLRPTAVILGLERIGSRGLGTQILAAAPDTKVMLVARNECWTEILERGRGEARSRHIDGDVLEAVLLELADGPEGD